MSNTKVTMIDALVAQLNTISGIGLATRDLLTPANARKNTPYIGVITGDEVKLVEDDAKVRWALTVDLIVLVKGDNVEEWIDKVKSLVFAPGVPSPLPSPLPDTLATTIGALHVSVEGQNEVALVNADDCSSTRMVLLIIYVSDKHDI